MLEELLEEEGYAVDTATDGLAALEYLEERPAEVIVLDYWMPRCDGEEFARRYKEGVGDAAPIVLLTASHDLAERCRRVAADGCAGKPFAVDDLLAAVEGLTHGHTA